MITMIMVMMIMMAMMMMMTMMMLITMTMMMLMIPTGVPNGRRGGPVPHGTKRGLYPEGHRGNLLEERPCEVQGTVFNFQTFALVVPTNIYRSFLAKHRNDGAAISRHFFNELVLYISIYYPLHSVLCFERARPPSPPPTRLHNR